MIDNNVERVKYHMEEIMKILEIPKNDSTENTPLRVSKMWCNEVFANRNNYNIDKLNARMKVFDNVDDLTDLVIVKDIPFSSTCFTGKTPVRMKDGLKYIKDVEVGDIAITFNEEGNIEEKRVTHLMRHTTRETVNVHTERGRKIRCTPDHPFYVENVGWTNAEDLVEGDKLRALNNSRGFKGASTWDYTINENYSLGYVLGAIASDGSTNRNQVRLEVNDLEFAEKFRDHMYKAFNIKAEITKTEYSSGYTPNKHTHRNLVRVISGYLVDYLKQVFGGSTDSKEFKFPKIVLNSYDIFKGFVNGYFEGDGSSYKEINARIITTNKEFAKEFSSILGGYHYEKENGDYSNIHTVGVPLHLLDMNRREYEKIKYEEMWEEEFKNEEKVVINPLVAYDYITLIEELPKYKVNVYNFEVEDNHTYLANDIWVHNCEHHFMPFMGTISVGYVPNKSIVGLSKIPRAVKFFSKKPQIQERLVQEIADYLNGIIEPKAIYVIARDSVHTCVLCRGAESECDTDTIYTMGDKSYMTEFLTRIR